MELHKNGGLVQMIYFPFHLGKILRFHVNFLGSTYPHLQGVQSTIISRLALVISSKFQFHGFHGFHICGPKKYHLGNKVNLGVCFPPMVVWYSPTISLGFFSYLKGSTIWGVKWGYHQEKETPTWSPCPTSTK